MNIPPLYLISHIPCSFNCKESIKTEKDILKVLKIEAPDFAEKTVNALKKVFLFFDDFNWVVFDGKVKNNELKDYKVLPYKSLIPKEKIKLIKEGNKIKIFNDEVLIIKDDETLLKIPKREKYDGIFIDFN